MTRVPTSSAARLQPAKIKEENFWRNSGAYRECRIQSYHPQKEKT